MLLTPEEQQKLAELVNARIDLPWVPEDMELSIFVHAVHIVDLVLRDVLPQVFGDLMHNDQLGIDPAEAGVFRERLVHTLNQKLNLPYLSEEQEARFLEVVADPIVQAMTDGENIDRVLDTVKSEVAHRLETGGEAGGASGA